MRSTASVVQNLTPATTDISAEYSQLRYKYSLVAI